MLQLIDGLSGQLELLVRENRHHDHDTDPVHDLDRDVQMHDARFPFTPRRFNAFGRQPAVVPRTLAEEEGESCVSSDDVSEEASATTENVGEDVGADTVVYEEEVLNPHTVVSRATSNLSNLYSR
jgi:hypothetical protein